MPIYVFGCTACGREVEELRKMGDNTPPEVEEACPQGGRCTMQQRITAAGLNFVGEGWGGWEVSQDGNFLAKHTPGKRNYAKYGKSKKAKEKKSSDV